VCVSAVRFTAAACCDTDALTILLILRSHAGHGLFGDQSEVEDSDIEQEAFESRYVMGASECRCDHRGGL